MHISGFHPILNFCFFLYYTYLPHFSFKKMFRNKKKSDFSITRFTIINTKLLFVRKKPAKRHIPSGNQTTEPK